MPLPALPDPQKDQAERVQAVFDKWMDECREVEDTVVEVLLANLPSLRALND